MQGYGTPYYGTGPSLNYNSSTKELSYPTDKLSAFTSDALVYRIDFYTTVKGSNTKVDTVDFVISKSKQGITCQNGKQEVTIYICSNSTPSRPTFSTLPTATGAYNWSLDAHYLSDYTTWSSKGTYNPNTNSIDLIPDTSYRWTEPVKFSGKDGANGADGRNAYSPYVGSDDFWYYWDDASQKYVQGRYAKGDTGPSGPAGPALVFRGDFSSDKTYYWTDDRRDVVKNNGQYYIVKKKGSTNKLDGFQVMSSFEMVATGLLLAQTANIAGWNFDPTGIIYSANKKVVLNPGNDAASDNPVFAIGIDDIVTDKGDKHTGSLLQMYAGGILTVGPRTINGNAASAGMAGNGKWRFWAGTNYGNAGSAPFRVDGDGNMYATSGTFTGSVNCKSLNVSSNYLSNWNGPGTLFCIYHVGRTKYNLVNIGGNSISGVTTSGGGYVFSHNFGTSQISALHIGSMRGGDSAGFAGSAVINEVTSTTVKMTFIDTKGNAHALDSSAAADIYFFRMK